MLLGEMYRAQGMTIVYLSSVFIIKVKSSITLQKLPFLYGLKVRKCGIPVIEQLQTTDFMGFDFSRK